MATAAVSLDRCSVPKRAPIELLPFDEVEFGMGRSSLLDKSIFNAQPADMSFTNINRHT